MNAPQTLTRPNHPVAVDSLTDPEWERFVAADEVAMLRLHVEAGDRLTSILCEMIRR